jgi:hypothetical protein
LFSNPDGSHPGARSVDVELSVFIEYLFKEQPYAVVVEQLLGAIRPDGALRTGMLTYGWHTPPLIFPIDDYFNTH